MAPDDETLVLYSRLAFYPVHWLALTEIVRRYAVRAVVLAAPAPQLPSVHEQLGTAGPDDAAGLPIEVRRMPTGTRRARAAWLARQLRDVGPDAVWVQEEPIDPFLLEILALQRFRRRPRIVTAVCENIFPPPPLHWRLARRALWPRLDGVVAVATASLEGIRAAGLPRSVPASTLVAGALEPTGPIDPLPLPFERGDGDFVVGFAGSVIERKGWKVLVEALRRLPAEFRLVVAGDGEQLPELERRAAEPGLVGRLHHVGLLPKARLWSFYAALDCLAVPSLTTARWKEQFGGVIADGMVMGLPVVGSSSGAIPEVLGPAGLVVPEDDAEALAAALARLRDDPALRERLGEEGRNRFRREFSIPVYADRIAASLRLRPRVGSAG
jgi:glycosyltransferase involved in cell wall biosynthesis